MTTAAPVISPMVSFLTRRPVRMAAAITGETSPRMICRIRSIISSWKISRCSMVRWSAACGVMVRVRAACIIRGSGTASGGARSGPAEEVRQQGVAVLGEDGLGMELHAFDRQLAMAQAHDLLDRAVFVLGPGGDFKASRQAGL